MPRLRLTALALAALALCVPAAASANQQAMFSIMMDDDQLLYRGDDARDAAMTRMKRLGVDTVRVTVLWEVVAEHARTDRRGKRRRHFRADDPRTYPKGNWDKYDRLVRAGQTLGIQVYFNVTGPGPAWAHKRVPKKSLRKYQRMWKPKPQEFFKFVKALGKRYDGTYRDENDSNRVLPRVAFWSIYNEPNQNGWLMPQWEKGVPWSAVMYRELWYYGRAALEQTGHGSDTILIGETAPLGSNRKNPQSPVYPKRFIRELFCVGPDNQPYTGSAASRRKCSMLQKIGKFKFTGWAHHPYTKVLAPTQRDKNPDSITMANVNELSALVDIVGNRTQRLAQPTAVMLTEFGYETNPPDPFSGIDPVKQAEYINIGDYIAYKDARILANTQFLLRDVAPVRRSASGKRIKSTNKRYWFTYQSGLQYDDGRPKPAAQAYAMPIHVIGRGPDSTGADGVFLWGWVRFLPFFHQSQVSLQFKPRGAADFSTIGDPVPVTNGAGFWEAHRQMPVPGSWRAVWVEPTSGTALTSREAATPF